MIVFGLTGGIASGKSYVAALFAERGAVVLDADRLARDAINEPEVRGALVARWGDTILDPEGQIDRGAIARRVFGEGDGAENERRFLEALIHPRVRERLRAGLEAAAAAGAPAAVLDVPLLLEAGWADECDCVVFIEAASETRLARAAGRGWDAEELDRREAAQAPLAEKRSRADRVLPGDNAAAARAGVAAIWDDLSGDSAAG